MSPAVGFDDELFLLFGKVWFEADATVLAWFHYQRKDLGPCSGWVYTPQARGLEVGHANVEQAANL